MSKKKNTFPTINLHRQLIEQAADAIFTVDLKGYIVYANKAASEIIACPQSKIVGAHFTAFVDKDSLKIAKDHFNKVKNDIVVVRDELSIVDAKGHIKQVEFTASPMYDGKNIFQINTIVRDVSKRKQWELLMLETEKMRAVQNFISGTAQEIKHPLKGVVNLTRRLIDQYKHRDFEYIGYKEFNNIIQKLETMHERVQYCYDTTDRLIKLNQRKAGIAGHFCDVNKVVGQSLKLVKHNLEVADIKVKVNLEKGLPAAAINESELTHTVINVLTNAIQSISTNGKISVKTSYNAKEDKVEIECRDNGIGIPKEALPYIFEPFFTTKERGLEKNSGLGLSIVYSIIKSYRGDIQIKSSQKTGTAAKIILCVSRKSSAK